MLRSTFSNISKRIKFQHRPINGQVSLTPLTPIEMRYTVGIMGLVAGGLISNDINIDSCKHMKILNTIGVISYFSVFGFILPRTMMTIMITGIMVEGMFLLPDCCLGVKTKNE